MILKNMDPKKLEEAVNSIRSEKKKEYGPFSEKMENIAQVWSVLLKDYVHQPIPGWIIPLLYSAAKHVRATNEYKEDNYIDAINYLIEADEMQKKETTK